MCPGEWDALTPLGFWDTNGSPNLSQTTRPDNDKHCWNRPEYCEESWRFGDTSCHSDSSKRPSAYHGLFVCWSLKAYQPILGYLMPNPFLYK